MPACVPPAVVTSTAPAFPKDVTVAARGATLEAGVSVAVRADGSVSSDGIVQTTGIPQLDAAALAAVRQWQFTPLQTGCTRDAAYTVAVDFSNVALPPRYQPCNHEVFPLVAVVPDFPDAAKSMGAAPRNVSVALDVDATGRVTQAVVVQSSAIDSLDAAAMKAAQASVYAPKFANCKAVAGKFLAHVMFDPNR